MLFIYWQQQSAYASEKQPDNPIAMDAGFKIDMGCLGHLTLIQRVDPKSPAAEGGLLPGDEIVEIAGKPTIGLHPSKILALLNGPESLLKLRVLRNDQLLSYSLSKNFAIPAWNEEGLKNQVEQARDQDNESRIASLLNLSRFYDERLRWKDAEPYLLEARALSVTTFHSKDPKLVVVLSRLMKHYYLRYFRYQILARSYAPYKDRIDSLKPDQDELFALTDKTNRIPKSYAVYFYQLADIVPDVRAHEFYEMKEQYLRRAAEIAVNGADSSNGNFDSKIGPRENVGFGYGTSDIGGPTCVTRYKLRDILDSLAHVLYWDNKKVEALEAAKQCYDNWVKFRSRWIPNGFGITRAGLLLEFYTEQNRISDALSLLQDEIAYARSVLPYAGDDVSRFEWQSEISGCFLKAGILRETVHEYKTALSLYEQSLAAMTVLDTSPNLNISFPRGPARSRKYALSSIARCEAALGDYEAAKKHFAQAIGQSEQPIQGIPQILDLALVDLLSNDKAAAQRSCLEVSALLQTKDPKVIFPQYVRYAILDTKLLSDLDKTDESVQLSQAMISAMSQPLAHTILKDHAALLQQFKQRLTTPVRDHPNEKDGTTIAREVTDGLQMPDVFLTLRECDNRP